MLSLASLGALSAVGEPEPVKWLSQQPVDFQLQWFAAGAVLEAGCTLPRFTGLFELKDDVTPGRFPPLGPGTQAADATELAIGRVAMLAVFAALVNGALLS